MTARHAIDELSLTRALRIIDDAWNETQRSAVVRAQMGITPVRLPDLSFAEAQRRSGVGCELLHRLAAVDSESVPHDLALTLRLAQFRAGIWSRQADWYWTAIDAMGSGTFGLFLPTAYCGGSLLNVVKGQLASFIFTDSADVDRYLALVADYVRLIDEISDRTAGQASRGIFMPKVQIAQARALLGAFKCAARSTLSVASERLARTHAATDQFVRELDNRITHYIEPAFDRAIDGLSGVYEQRAPETVGILQYPGGREIYAELVKQHTTLDLTADEVHGHGFLRMEEIENSMRALQAELGFDADRSAFMNHLGQDKRWRADTPEGVANVFQRYIDRLKPRIDDFFAITPQASYGVQALPETLQGSMTFGFYDPPKRDRARGLYMFNAANTIGQPLFNVAALAYHELMPGHHLHFATQQENPLLHPFRTYSFVNAYIEGWAEYAAAFAGEIGMYEFPQERYGRLVMDAFLTSRLVVDTGMNALGWSLERAREYMREHSRLSEGEVLTESIRYSCDIPGQSLAYKLGDTKIFAMRERMRTALGQHFNLKDFHTSILGPGALPLSDLEWHVDHQIEALKERNWAQ